MMDLRTFQNPLELFTLMPFDLIVKKCLVGYVVSVAGGMVDSFILNALPTQWHCRLLKHRQSFGGSACWFLCILGLELIVCRG